MFGFRLCLSAGFRIGFSLVFIAALQQFLDLDVGWFFSGIGFGLDVLLPPGRIFGFGFFSVFLLDIVFCFDDVKLHPSNTNNNYFANAFSKTNSSMHCC